MKRLYFSFLLLFSLSTSIYAQNANTTPVQVKAAMTYKIAQNIEWPDEADFNTFNFGVLAHEKHTAEEFSKTLKGAFIQNKPVKVSHFNKISQIKDIQVVYADSLFSQALKEILVSRKFQPVLIVSDGAEDKKSVMVNLYHDRDNLKFEINKANTINAGLSINPNLILLGGTEIDVAALYKDSQQNLEKEKEKVSQQQQELERMRVEIEHKKEEIEKQKQEIINQKAAIEEQKAEISNQKLTLVQLNKSVKRNQDLLDERVKVLNKHVKKIADQEAAIREQETQMQERTKALNTVTLAIEKQQKHLNEQKLALAQQETTIKIQKNLIYIFILFLGLVAALAFIIFRSYLIQKKFNRKLAEKNEEIIQQREELQTQTESLHAANNEIKVQSLKLEELYKEVKDSIAAAQIFQQSLLPSQALIKTYLPESFILNKPKNIVSGDFYWFDVKDNKIIIAAADCTGHGVSGAFMSITGHHLLNDCIYPFKELRASDILNRLNEGVIREFNQRVSDTKFSDGMDIALCIIDQENKKLQYAGANNPLYILRNGEIIQIKADRFPIGLVVKNKTYKFSNKEIDLLQGDIIYIFSDGYADQFGGEFGDEKFLYSRFRETLISIGSETMEEQLATLDETLNSWKRDVEQLDDILVIGFKV